MEIGYLLSAISISGRLYTRGDNFLKTCEGLTTYYVCMRFLDMAAGIKARALDPGPTQDRKVANLIINNPRF